MSYPCSIRPSAQYRSNRQAQVTATPESFTIIGDTVTSILYAEKLYQNFKDQATPPQIYVITNGNDQMTDVNIEALDYIVVNNKTIDKVLNNTRVHLILKDDEVRNPLLVDDNTVFESYYQYFTGAGIGGDFNSAYTIPCVGPWFTSDSRGRIQSFVKTYTVQKELTKNEMIVANNLATLLNLAKTTSIVATKPSVLMLNNIFIYHESSQIQRQLFRDMYTQLLGVPWINFVTHTNNLVLQASPTSSCLQTVFYSTLKEPLKLTQIDNTCVLWMSNLYTYIQTMGISKIPHRKISVPVFYRIVLPINQINPITGVDLSGENDLGDGVSMRVNFCCTDVSEPGESQNSLIPTWYVTCYTTNEDFGQPNGSGAFANTSQGKTLLIVETLSLINRRVYSYDDVNLSVSVALNSNQTELQMYGKFLLIAANVYMSITGTPPQLPFDFSICNDQGLCTDTFPLETTSYRESPLLSVIRMLTSLYGQSNTVQYPTPNLVNGPQCCG